MLINLHNQPKGLDMRYTAEQKIQRAYAWFMREVDYAWIVGVLMVGKREISDTIPTACTDGYNVVYGRKFIEALSEPEVRGVVLHENYHKALQQITVWKGLQKKNAKVANYAWDYVVNLLIVDGDSGAGKVVLPKGVLIDRRFHGMDSRAVFEILLAEGDPEGDLLDQHDTDSEENTPADELESRQIEVQDALRQGVLRQAALGSLKNAKGVVELMQPVVDWREVLLEFVTSTTAGRDISTWKRPSRKWVHEDVYLPSCESEAIGGVVVAIDTSGSVSGGLVNRFVSELVSICNTANPEWVKVVFWDTAVVGEHHFERGGFEGMEKVVRPVGGGGTSPKCIPKWMHDNKVEADLCVILTDGHVGEWGSWGCRTLWGITTKGITPPVGTSVFVGE